MVNRIGLKLATTLVEFHVEYESAKMRVFETNYFERCVIDWKEDKHTHIY